MDEAIVQAIVHERAYQQARWDDAPHTVGEWLLIVEAELLEAKQAWVKGHGNHEALTELVQVLAVGVACLEQHGVPPEDPRRALIRQTHRGRES
jgi:hypothetical protein